MKRLRLLYLRHQRLVAATLAGLGVACSISAISAEPPGVAVTVAAADLPSGHILRTDDVKVVHLPTAPHGALSRTRVVGHMVGASMRAGEAFTDRRVVDPRHLPAGLVLVEVPVSARTTTLLRVGDRVDVLAATENEAEPQILASDVQIVVMSGRHDDQRSAGLATTREASHAIAAAQMTSQLTLAAT